jgi:XRE family transcriptional regulator, aerobic/anaerobic benzoate catabolism transcriptional regulator
MGQMRDGLLGSVGDRVRSRREALGWTQAELARRAGLSVRFLAQLERGEGNISLLRFAAVAGALGATPAEMLEGAGGVARPAPRAIALLGLRGAGKSTAGAELARRLGVPFVELDERIEASAGLPLAQLFELHGEAYYRRLERETLRRLLAEPGPAVIATGGSLVTDRETWRLLRDRAVTVWLRARPEDHWDRVVAQGDRRPMGENPHAFAELRALLAAREPLYATAHHVVDTSETDLLGVVAALERISAPGGAGGAGAAG